MGGDPYGTPVPVQVGTNLLSLPLSTSVYSCPPTPPFFSRGNVRNEKNWRPEEGRLTLQVRKET